MLVHTFARVAALAALLVAPPLARPAHAGWSGFSPMASGAMQSDPSCAAFLSGDSTAVCAVIGAGSKLYYSAWNGGAWSGWAVQGNPVTSAPSCANAGSGAVICASRNTSFVMVVQLDQAGSFSSVLTLPVFLGSAPSCTWIGVNPSVLCAGRGLQGQLVAAVFNGGTWGKSAWTVLPAGPSGVYSSVSCAFGGVEQGDATCAWITTNSNVATDIYDGGAWQGVVNTGGTATNPPFCLTNADGWEDPYNVACVATGTDSALWYHNTGDPWYSLSGLVHGYSCAPYGGFEWTCGVTGLATTGFYTNDGPTNGNWVQHGTGTFIGTPSCFALNTTGQVMCVVERSNGQGASIIGP